VRAIDTSSVRVQILRERLRGFQQTTVANAERAAMVGQRRLVYCKHDVNCDPFGFFHFAS
jgi:hypothetical protein